MKTLYTKSLLLFAALILLYCTATLAQAVKTTASIAGTVLDDKGGVMPYATVALLKATDSTLVKGTITTDAGSYKFEHVNPGNYVVRVTVMGFAKANSKTITVGDNATTINLPAIQLGNASKALKEVSITAAKPLIERKLDRTVMNVENSVLAAGNSALEILAKAPGVTVDKDDNISLKGKQGVTVMLDGKLTYLSAAQLGTLLRSTDGNTIQSIEIITNPSAKYDASGNSGIINIKLKKNKSAGTNGSLSLTGGYGTYTRDNASLTLNHKEGNVNIFGSFAHGDRSTYADLLIDRDVMSPTGNTYFTQHTFLPQKRYYNTYSFGADFDTSPKNTLGFLVNGYFNGEHDNNDNNTFIGTKPGVTDSYQNTASTIDQGFKNVAFNLNDKYTIDTAGQELSVDIDYSKFNNTNNAHYDTYFFLPDGSTQSAPNYIRNQSPSVITINTEKFDYSKPLNKDLKLETGFKASSVKTDNDLEAQTLTGNVWVNDPTRTNRFVYDEKLVAGYVNLSQTFKKTSVQVGLRAENTNSTGNSITTNNVVTRSYLDFFPSLFVNQTLSDKNEVSFSYSRRIDRPSYDNLNPFIFYLDQYTYNKGNPFLNPQYTQSFEFDYTYNKSITTGLSYSHTASAITQVLLPDNDKTYQTIVNLQSQDSYNINVNAPYNFTKWWSGNANFNAFYLHFKADSLPGNTTLNDGQLAFQFKATNTFVITKTLKGEISTDYQSPLTYGLLKIRSQYSTDAGLSTSFADKKATLKLSVSDIFNTDKNRISSNYTNQTLQLVQKNESRIARLTFTYNFGNSKIKTRQHSTDSDEKNRVKGSN